MSTRLGLLGLVEVQVYLLASFAQRKHKLLNEEKILHVA